MAIAFVLIRTLPGHEREVYYNLYNLKGNGISEVHPVIGNYNLVAKINAEYSEELGYIVLNKINRIENINSTEMLTTVEF
ncbi:Lrp/AsnC ligand binding domain-containing protein [[Eubacterium] cellulosolvens]